MQFLERLKEPSSYAAIAPLFVLLGINVDPGLMQYATTALASLAGIAGFFLAERTK